MYDDRALLKAVNRLPPRALRGRWGSISAVEQFLIDAGPKQLPPAFRSAPLSHFAILSCVCVCVAICV